MPAAASVKASRVSFMQVSCASCGAATVPIAGNGQAGRQARQMPVHEPQTQRSNPMDNDDAISELNHLIETCRDGEYGFRTSAERVQSPELRTVLQDRARSC